MRSFLNAIVQINFILIVYSSSFKEKEKANRFCILTVLELCIGAYTVFTSEFQQFIKIEAPYLTKK